MMPLGPDDLNQVAPGIFYTARPLVLADRKLIMFLKEAALRTPTRRARVCTHANAEADQHHMLIVSACDTYVAPHRHHGKSETFLIVEGKADLLLFDPDGRLADVVAMGSAESGLPFFYQMPAGQYHSLAIHSDVLVFAESTKGPFRREDTENAPWAPGAEASIAGRAYLKSSMNDRRK